MTVDNAGSHVLGSLPFGTDARISNGGSMIQPSIGEDGRIRLPGIPAGLSINAYLPLVHLYATILEASRILDRYRHQLSLLPGGSGSQEPLTPLESSNMMRNLYYKREDQTITRAYKVRGAVVGMAKVMESRHYNRFLAVSTGNHALGVLKAAELLRPRSVRIVVPESTAASKLEKIANRVEYLNSLGVEAGVVYAGKTFDEARAWAMAQDEGEYYLDPYSDPWVVAGQGTIGLELFSQLTALLEANSDVDEVVVVLPVGGGGLLAGTATALKMASAWDPRFRSVNVTLLGLRLASLETLLGDAIRVSEVASVNRMLFSSLGIPLVDIDDQHMAEGMARVHADIGALVEGPCGATLYPVCHMAPYQPDAGRLVVSVLSGGNVSGLPAAAVYKPQMEMAVR